MTAEGWGGEMGVGGRAAKCDKIESGSGTEQAEAERKRGAELAEGEAERIPMRWKTERKDRLNIKELGPSEEVEAATEETRGEAAGMDVTEADQGRDSGVINGDEKEEGAWEKGTEMEELLDIETDPFGKEDNGLDAEWEERVRRIPVRIARPPAEQQQRAKIWELLLEIEFEPEEPDEGRVTEALNWLQNLPEGILDHEQFVAQSFSTYLPAWEQLLENSPRESAKAVLSWLRRGFKPRFVGTEGAKQQKPDIVRAILMRIVPKEQVKVFLSGKYLHKVQFYQSHVILRKRGLFERRD
jgi:hypothetical protein